MAAGDLTTLAKVKEWLSTGDTEMQGDEKLLSRLITAASTFIPKWLDVNLVPATYDEKYNGFDQSQLYLRNNPVVNVSALKINGVTVPPNPNPPLGTGFLYDDTSVYVTGCSSFCRGVQNIEVTYVAGFQINGEAQTVPSDGKLSTDILSKSWNCDRGVVNTQTGASLTLVPGAPALGQYQLLEDDAGTMQYIFNTANADLAIGVSYGYTPEDVVEVVTESVAEIYKKRTRIGANSINMGNGQVVSYSTKDMNDWCKTVLNQYRNVVPVQ